MILTGTNRLIKQKINREVNSLFIFYNLKITTYNMENIISPSRVSLTKSQTLTVIYLYNKRNFVNSEKNYKFATKFKTRCLYCGCDIFIGYGSFKTENVFCKIHAYRGSNTNIIQQHYMKRIKEEQLKIGEKVT